MKKTFLVGALVALAMTFTSCMDGLLADPEPFTITYKDSAQWAAPTLEVKDNYDFIEIEFDATKDDLANIQVCAITDAVEAEQSWGTSYFTNYITVPEDGKLKVVFADELAKQTANGAKKITKLTIQNKLATGFDLKVKKATITKKDGYQLAAEFAGDWGSTVAKD